MLRGEGKVAPGVDCSVWHASNELFEIDLRLDSRVESAMGDEAVFFSPYGEAELRDVLEPWLDRAFREGTLSEAAVDRGVREAARWWADARKALPLFRQP